LFAILLAFFVILTGFNLGPMREAERRVEEEGKLLRDGAIPMISTDVAMAQAMEGTPGAR